jgi:hypothetical protein
VATSANILYKIELNPYFLKKNETIEVFGPFVIEYDDPYLHLNSVLKKFEITKDKDHQEIEIYGL